MKIISRFFRLNSMLVIASVMVISFLISAVLVNIFKLPSGSFIYIIVLCFLTLLIPTALQLNRVAKTRD